MNHAMRTRQRDNGTRLTALAAMVLAIAGTVLYAGQGDAPVPATPTEILQAVLTHTEELAFPRGNRLPLYIWALRDAGEDAAVVIGEHAEALAARGIAPLIVWNGRNTDRLDRLTETARAIRAAGLPVSVDATGACMGFYDATTAHVDDAGEPFFDTSIAHGIRFGCPWNLDHRLAPMRDRQQRYIEAFESAGLSIDLWMADWELDGPIEWNRAWEHARRCARCRAKAPGLDTDFAVFQDAYRGVRAQLQRTGFVEPVMAHNPRALVGNYGVYAHDGFRIWWDYFENREPFLARLDEIPHRREGNAYYRRWAHEFGPSGYTMGMPVLYTWYHIWTDYDYEPPAYRWLYGMLLQASRAARHAPGGSVLLPFVTGWDTTNAPDPRPDGLEPLSRELYREALWHMLLRGHAGFVMWTPMPGFIEELQSVHAVYAAALEFRDFLEHGEPVMLDLPPPPGPIVSALRKGNRLLVRRTDLVPDDRPVILYIDDLRVSILPLPGQCQIHDLPAPVVR